MHGLQVLEVESLKYEELQTIQQLDELMVQPESHEVQTDADEHARHPVVQFTQDPVDEY